MDTKKNAFTLSLMIIILSGCTQNVDMWGTGDYGGYDYYSSYIVIPLNSTETKLKGKWNLKSISTIDSLYTDSSIIKDRYFEFSDSGLFYRQKPRYTDQETGVSFRKIPNKYPGQFYNGEYYSPDTSHLKIITSDNYTYLDSSLLKIVSLTETKLSLRDSASNFQWNFVR